MADQIEHFKSIITTINIIWLKNVWRGRVCNRLIGDPIYDLLRLLPEEVTAASPPGLSLSR